MNRRWWPTPSGPVSPYLRVACITLSLALGEFPSGGRRRRGGTRIAVVGTCCARIRTVCCHSPNSDCLRMKSAGFWTLTFAITRNVSLRANRLLLSDGINSALVITARFAWTLAESQTSGLRISSNLYAIRWRTFRSAERSDGALREAGLSKCFCSYQAGSVYLRTLAHQSSFVNLMPQHSCLITRDCPVSHLKVRWKSIVSLLRLWELRSARGLHNSLFSFSF